MASSSSSSWSTCDFVEVLNVEKRTVSVVLFEDVENASELRSKVMKNELPCAAALVDAAYVASRRQIVSATYQAVRRWQNTKGVLKANDLAKSRTLETEFVYSLSSATSVGEALRTVGLQDTTRQLLVVAFDADKLETLLSLVRGTRRPLSAIDILANDKRDALIANFNIKDQELNLVGGIHAAILSRLAAKDC